MSISHRILRFLILLLGKIIYKWLFLRCDRGKHRQRGAGPGCLPGLLDPGRRRRGQPPFLFSLPYPLPGRKAVPRGGQPRSVPRISICRRRILCYNRSITTAKDGPRPGGAEAAAARGG